MKGNNILSIRFLISVMALLCFLLPAYAQWIEHVIDPYLLGAYGVYVADMDNDNGLDVVATARTANDVVWYEAPFWTKHYIDQDFCDAYGVFVANIDGDNDLDVIATGLYADDVVWYESSLEIDEEITSDQTDVISFLQPFPNPFNERTEIRYQTGNSSKASLKIYDVSGRWVRQWDNMTIRQSDHIIWDGTDNLGIKVPTGIYFVELTVEQMRKLLLVK
jgi:hypothetical protein